MNRSNQNEESIPSIEIDEQRFIQRALAEVEKLENFQRIKRIAVTALAFAGALWFATKSPAESLLGVECTVLIMVGLMLAVCTSKILLLINRNSKAILQAIAQIQRNSTM